FLSHGPAPPDIYTLSLHDALPISFEAPGGSLRRWPATSLQRLAPPIPAAASAAGTPRSRSPAGARRRSPEALWFPRCLRRFPKRDRKSTRLNSSHVKISYAVFCLK